MSWSVGSRSGLRLSPGDLDPLLGGRIWIRATIASSSGVTNGDSVRLPTRRSRGAIRGHRYLLVDQSPLRPVVTSRLARLAGGR